MTNRKLPKHLETIINEACWGVPGVGQLTGEAKLRAILEAAWEVAEHRSAGRTALTASWGSH